MVRPWGADGAGEDPPRRLRVFTARLATDPRLKRILAHDGWQVAPGWPRAGDAVGVWGASPHAWRGLAVARRTGAPVVRIEDAWLRSLRPGRAGEPPLGLLVDRTGVHFDARKPSDLETLLATHPLDDAALLDRARGAMAWMRRAHLSKYSATDPDLPCPAPGYVLVIDQTRGDASVSASLTAPEAARARFREMLFMARDEHPGARIVIKTHPETRDGHRPGHFTPEDLSDRVSFCTDPVSPWALLEGAAAVYTLSSQMGFEAILAGHKPRVFGTPFYAGWGLSTDEDVLPRRGRALTRAQLFAAAVLLYPVWHDPYRNRRAALEDVLGALDAQVRAWREDRAGWVARGMRLWKRRPLQRFYGSGRGVVFEDDPARAAARAARDGRRLMVWAGRAEPGETAVRVEDGFLRSRGLGAELVPPLSLAADDMGIYYDPRTPSRLERLIAEAADLPDDRRQRARRLIRTLVASGVSKYNLAGAVPDLPEGRRILVPGQVEDDASILCGTDAVATNAALLARVRDENPHAVIVWKPHPDVIAGLRQGHVADPLRWADVEVGTCDMAALLKEIDEVWTMTSLTGFEALLRGRRVVALGAPFYAGWGLTRDLGTVPARRLGGRRPDLEALVHAALVDYPRYRDPVTGLPCPVEVAAERLARGEVAHPGIANRALSKLQGLLASRAHLWRGRRPG
ncbi:capsular polysaccharide biosynthesis protein [Roseivivax isoporae]|uniref:Capsular polysaccharide biosynthesis protein n=1 Tax=Roseivivax isoporae LMG 25204 TaxID=1449351 RepID=X7F3H9_9RHOB|nr:capsular polysaccharide biosynthesis protein [Roseivivax isoporae]ETX27365.1 capsular polysaccharide biosynthesis protein [Roseivivax isoporae LMG 25204]